MHLPAVPLLARAVVIGRIPGWQIALIAADLAAVAVAMFVDRAWAARKTHATTRSPGHRNTRPVSFRSQSTITPPARDLNPINEPAIPA